MCTWEKLFLSGVYLCAANPEADDAEPGVAGAGPGVPALDADERASAITLARVATLQIINKLAKANWIYILKLFTT